MSYGYTSEILLLLSYSVRREEESCFKNESGVYPWYGNGEWSDATIHNNDK